MIRKNLRRIASMGLAAVAAHKLGGLVPVGAIFKASVRIGRARMKAPGPVGPEDEPLRVLQNEGITRS